MSSVIINDIDCESVQRAELLLGDIPGDLNKAIKKASEKTAKYLRAISSQLIRKRYAISATALRDKDVCKVHYSIWDGLGVTINFAGHKIPLYRFDGTSPKRPGVDSSQKKIHAIIQGKWLSVYPSLPVRGRTLKSKSPTLFKHAFIAEMKNANGHNHTGIFERNGGASKSSGDSISEIMGLSVPQMLGNPEVMEELSRQAVAKFDETMEQVITDILMGRR